MFAWDAAPDEAAKGAADPGARSSGSRRRDAADAAR